MKNNFVFLEIFVLKLIRLYQKTLSFDHGWFKSIFPYGYCKYNPTCSEYTYKAIQKYGLWKGGLNGIKRIFSCHPWSKGGNDYP